MGIVQRFERKLEGAVGDVFARVFGGAVVPREVEQRLQREISDHVRELGGGHYLAPNHYQVTLSAADHARLSEATADTSGDRRRVEDALARFVARHITASGWQTYGAIVVDLVGSPSLHTGQFRTSSTVDPDAAISDAAVQSEPGAASMSHSNDNPGFGRRDQPRERSGWDERNGWQRDDGQHDDQARNSNGQYGTEYGEGRDSRAPEYPRAGAAPGYPPAAGSAAPPRAWGSEREQGYADQGYAEQGGYADQGYADQNRADQNQYDRGYNNRGYDDRGSNDRYPPQTSYDDQDYGRRSQGAPDWDRRRELTGTLHLDDGSGRTYQLKQGVTVIGRGQEAQFRLADTGVSRRHVEISWDGEVAMLTDLGSTNGTTVNDASVQNWQLADGDVVRAGHSSIVVRLEG